jgi:hypothetical protein
MCDSPTSTSWVAGITGVNTIPCKAMVLCLGTTAILPKELFKTQKLWGSWFRVEPKLQCHLQFSAVIVMSSLGSQPWCTLCYRPWKGESDNQLLGEGYNSTTDTKATPDAHLLRCKRLAWERSTPPCFPSGLYLRSCPNQPCMERDQKPGKLTSPPQWQVLQLDKVFLFNDKEKNKDWKRYLYT